jgi:hypothetical protein
VLAKLLQNKVYLQQVFVLFWLNKIKMKNVFLKVAFTSGILTGIGCLLFLLLLYVSGLDALGEYKLLYLPIYATGIVGGLKFFRDYRNGGYLTGSKAVSMALIINAIGTIVYTILLFTSLSFTAGILDLHHQALQKWLLDNKEPYVSQFGMKQYEAQFAEIKNVTKNSVTVVEGIKTLLVGFVLAMATAVILKKSPPIKS